MKQDKKQTTQLIVLGILVVAFVGYISFKFVTPKKAQTPPAKTEQVPGDVGTASVMAQVEPGQVTDSAAAARTFPDLAVVPARRDPFTPVSLAGAPRLSSADSTLKPPRVTHSQSASARVPPMDLGPFSLFGRNSSGSAPVVVAREPDPQFTLTGVVCGEEDVAIIRGDGGERHVVKAGQLINGRYRVLAVTEDGVTLACDNRYIQLKLGGAKNAK